MNLSTPANPGEAWTPGGRTQVALAAILQCGGAKMTQTVLPRVNRALPRALKVAVLTLGGTLVAALLIGWVAFLLWLVAEAVSAVVHWL